MASKPNNSRDVFVGSLPDDADEATISDIFSVVGDVQSVTIKEGKNNMSKFCFVRFFNEDNAETAIIELNGHIYSGKALSVKPAGRKPNKMEGGVMRPPEARNFPVSVQRRSPQIGYGNRPWGDAGYDREGSRMWKEETIAVTHVVDSTTFFAQICNAETATAYQTMINQLFEHCAYGPTPATEIQPNHVYGAIFSVDNGWYRCTVKGTDPTTGKVTVGFVDYGNEETVDAVVELPPALASVPFFAIQMSLYGLESAFPNKSSENAQKAFEYLSKLPEADKVTVRISNQQQRPQEYSVVVFLDGQNVNEIIQNNFADKRPSPAMSPVQQVQQLQQDVGGGGHYSTGRPSQLPQRNWNAPSPSGSNDSTAALVAQLQNEKANLIQKVHEMKMDMQVLGSTKEIEVNSYKEKVDFAIDYKVATVLGSLRRVKKARSLYPADDNQKAPLENAIDIIHGGEITLNGEKKTFRDATPKSNSVEEKLEVLNQWQDMIRSCSNKEELAQLVEKRNNARHESYQAMTDFLKVSDELPVGERLAALQDMLGTINAGYPSLLKPHCAVEGSPEETYDQYKAWLDLKMKKLRSYWKETDEALSSWEHILSDMTQAFSFSSCSEFEAKNLDASIQQLLVAMETELVVSCQGYEPHIPLNPEILKQRQAELQLENEVLTKTVQMVFRDINEEAALLDQLSTHCKRYKERMKELEEWLDATPNVDELQTLQKKIKVARSKLRHLLVDLRDGEEDPDLLGDKTVDELKGDIASYQEQLLKHYTREDELLLHLAQLTKKHFPELSMTHATLGLQKYIETDGLVKDGRDLMHFNLTPFPSCQKTTTKLASISSKGVAVIKSHHLPDISSQKAFLERVQTYQSISSPLLLPVYGIIPDNDSNQYHLQVWYHQLGSFKDVVMSDPPPSQSQTLTHLKNILLALQDLHNIQFIHGAVHPNNVLFKSTEEVYLAEYDLSKPQADKGKKAYMSSNGLCFQAPEIAHGASATIAADIFSFGILVLWAHYPTSPFKTKQNGTPDLDGLPIPRELVNFVVPMLHVNPSNRPTVKHILDFGYLDRLVSTQGTEEEQPSDPEPSQTSETSQTSDPEPSQTSDPEPSQTSDPEPSQTSDGVPSQTSDPEISQTSDRELSQTSDLEPSQTSDRELSQTSSEDRVEDNPTEEPQTTEEDVKEEESEDATNVEKKVTDHSEGGGQESVAVEEDGDQGDQKEETEEDKTLECDEEDAPQMEEAANLVEQEEEEKVLESQQETEEGRMKDEEDHDADGSSVDKSPPLTLTNGDVQPEDDTEDAADTINSPPPLLDD